MLKWLGLGFFEGLGFLVGLGIASVFLLSPLSIQESMAAARARFKF